MLRMVPTHWEAVSIMGDTYADTRTGFSCTSFNILPNSRLQFLALMARYKMGLGSMEQFQYSVVTSFLVVYSMCAALYSMVSKARVAPVPFLALDATPMAAAYCPSPTYPSNALARGCKPWSRSSMGVIPWLSPHWRREKAGSTHMR